MEIYNYVWYITHRYVTHGSMGGVLAEQSGTLVFLISRVWVRVPVLTLTSICKALNHDGLVLQVGRKAVGPVCCVMHIREPGTLIIKRRGLPLCFWHGWLQIALHCPETLIMQNTGSQYLSFILISVSILS